MGNPIAFNEHLAFFDADGDHAISLYETKKGLERLGFGHLLTIPGAVAINVGVTALGAVRGWFVNPAHLALPRTGFVRHPDSAFIDDDGNFVDATFEAAFARYGRTFAGDALTVPELLTMLGVRVLRENANDLLLLPVGVGAVVLEWAALLWVAGTLRRGRLVLTKDAVRRFYTDPRFFDEAASRIAARRRARRRTGLGMLRNVLQRWVL